MVPIICACGSIPKFPLDIRAPASWLLTQFMVPVLARSYRIRRFSVIFCRRAIQWQLIFVSVPFHSITYEGLRTLRLIFYGDSCLPQL